jgi:hypothetical protein
VGEHKLKRHRAEPKPFIGIYPLIVARPGIFRADPGQLAIIVDEPDYPLVAIQTPAAGVADLLRAVDRVVVGRAHHRVATDFFSAFHDWCDNKRNPVPGVPDDFAYAAGLAIVFWMAFRDAPDAPGRSQMLQAGVDEQLEDHSAAAITLAILDVPITTARSGKVAQTRRWMMHHGEPEYLDHRIADFGGEFVLHVRPE